MTISTPYILVHTHCCMKVWRKCVCEVCVSAEEWDREDILQKITHHFYSFKSTVKYTNLIEPSSNCHPSLSGGHRKPEAVIGESSHESTPGLLW